MRERKLQPGTISWGHSQFDCKSSYNYSHSPSSGLVASSPYPSALIFSGLHLFGVSEWAPSFRSDPISGLISSSYKAVNTSHSYHTALV